MPGDGADHDVRFKRLEEHAALVERMVEELSAEIAEQTRRIQDLRTRVERLERKLAAAGGDDGPD